VSEEAEVAPCCRTRARAPQRLEQRHTLATARDVSRSTSNTAPHVTSYLPAGVDVPARDDAIITPESFDMLHSSLLGVAHPFEPAAEQELEAAP